jgi:hypothetical protein
MGLDMYLSAEGYCSPYLDGGKRDALIEALGGDHPPMRQGSGVSVEIDVAYWRKANAIHQWFVDNAQGGVDDCRPYPVTLEQLEALRDLCRSHLGRRDPELAAEDLPTQEGFFFGSTEYGDDYWADLSDTDAQLTALLDWVGEDEKRGYSWDFSYRSSW